MLICGPSGGKHWLQPWHGTGLPAPCLVILQDTRLLPASPHCLGNGTCSAVKTPLSPSWTKPEGNPSFPKLPASSWVLQAPHSSPHT